MQIRHGEYAAALNFIKNGQSIGCTSVNIPVYVNDWTIDFESAFCFPVMGGNFQVVDNLKCALRYFMKLPGHKRSLLAEILFKEHARDMFRHIENDDRIPLQYRENMASYIGKLINL